MRRVQKNPPYTAAQLVGRVLSLKGFRLPHDPQSIGCHRMVIDRRSEWTLLGLPLGRMHFLVSVRCCDSAESFPNSALALMLVASERTFVV